MSTSVAAASSSSSSTKRKKAGSGGGGYDVPWVERYRPRTLDDVVGNEETLVRLRAIAEDGNMPNLILCGPPGTGKTTSVHALARQLLGSSYSAGVLELNASDARGIDVVRNKIKGFAMNKVNLPPGRHKIIILDEADSMTSAAQQALRRTMEIYSNTTRFALACNVSTKIIEPIQSRAAILRYSRLSDEQVLTRLKQVCVFEKVSYTDDGIEAIIFTAEGDMRNALNNLQATTSGFGHVNQTNVFKVCDQPHPTTVRAIIDHCVKGETNHAVAQLKSLWGTGYSCSDIIGTLFKVTKAHDMPEALKLEYLREIGFTHMRIADGVDSLLQLLGLVARLCQKVEMGGSVPKKEED
uniref:Replication factor C subunit 2 n=1 Tax=Helicotheca tamesis TaxID=374047 RepID=A0A7S2I8X7_9STRA